MSPIGIVGFGGFVPRLRIERPEVAATHAWFNPGLGAAAVGTRSTAGWDEDSVTMAVDAARDALRGEDRSRVDAVIFATTTAPFADRLNSAIIASALGLNDSTTGLDSTGSLRAGTTSLLVGRDLASARNARVLCVAADRRSAAPGTAQELTTGHGAAAIVFGDGPSVARIVSAQSLMVDFVDHFRTEGRPFDYQWEERWVREQGYGGLVASTISRLLDQAGISPEQIARVCMPSPFPRIERSVAKAVGLSEAALADELTPRSGDLGAAHPLAMLVQRLETARPGELLLVVGFGSGCDVILVEVEDAIVAYRQRQTGISKWLPRQVTCDYARYATLSGLLPVDRGIRAEADKSTAMTAQYRHRDLLLGLVGGRCAKCGTYQIPRTRICVNPDCHGLDVQAPYSFAESRGRVTSWSADSLTYTPDPPAYYGMIDFEEGGRLMMDFTDIPVNGIGVGQSMRMVFRVKDHDSVRGFTRYFWKAAPDSEQGVMTNG